MIRFGWVGSCHPAWMTFSSAPRIGNAAVGKDIFSDPRNPTNHRNFGWLDWGFEVWEFRKLEFLRGFGSGFDCRWVRSSFNSIWGIWKHGRKGMEIFSDLFSTQL